MSDRQLPEHLERMVTDLKNSRCGKTRSQGNPLAAKLRTILAAASAVIDKCPRPTDWRDDCWYCDVSTDCLPDCPHRQLKEALADD